MDFLYTITFTTEGCTVTREGRGLFYPSDCAFKIEDMLWKMTEEFGRPAHVNVEMVFFSADKETKLLR